MNANKVKPGWYPDPWREYTWRWWDGNAWTMHGSKTSQHKPHLQNWVSPFIIIGFVYVGLLIVNMVFTSALGIIGIILGLLPLLIAVPFLIWLDRVEPEPIGGLIHALLWGGTISILVAGLANDSVGYFFGDALAIVVSAPVVEEAMKGAALIFCLKRKQIDGPQDGIIYAIWAGVGFAVVENITYFSLAIENGNLTEVFISRSTLTFFAHPMFTLFIGLFIGLGVLYRKNLLLFAAIGYIIAVALHAVWNGSILLSETLQLIEIQIISILLFLTLFTMVFIILLVVRSKTKKRFAALVPVLTHKYGLTPYEHTTFSSWGNIIRERQRISRKNRWRFDNLHAAIARLALVQDQAGGIDPMKEKILIENLHNARAGAL